MKPPVMVSGQFDVHQLFDDLGLEFAMRPLYRVSFEANDRAVQRLAERYSDRVFRSYRRATPDGLQPLVLVLRFDAETFAVAMGDYRQTVEVYSATAQRAEAVYQELMQAQKREAPTDQPRFYMMRQDCGDFYTEEITDVPTLLNDQFLELCYGEGLTQWIAEFDKRTREKIGGITIFEGPPGTGKTTLISQLIRRLAATHVFYVLPAANEAALASPDMASFWLRQQEQHPNQIKVIVMEDAERVLVRREADNQQAVASLLNIADGLMGRMLRLHLLCSLNASLDDLDPAILRPGRLMNYRQFGLLSKASAAEIARLRNIPFEPAAHQTEFTLAEVLNPPVIVPTRKRGRIGF